MEMGRKASVQPRKQMQQRLLRLGDRAFTNPVWWFVPLRWVEAAVLSFGDGSCGALGVSPSFGPDVYEPTRIPQLPSNVSSIAAGHYHSLAITDEGEVWSWGRNEEGQLGRAHEGPRDSWCIPGRVNGLDKVKVCAAFASGVISMALGDDGSLWTWGQSKRGQLGIGEGFTTAKLPCHVKALAKEEITKVSLGWGHVLALTEEGKLFGWGYAADGRLGQLVQALDTLDSVSVNCTSELEEAEKLVLKRMDAEKHMPIIWEPSLLVETRGHKVTDIACGLDHSLVVCSNGTLLSGGDNIYGQLGRTSNIWGLQSVQMSWPPVSVSSGLGHSLAICHSEISSVVASWGWNCSSQLGRSGPGNLPGLVAGLEGEAPIVVTCGRVHSLVLTTKRKIWAWGSGKNGRLGLGSTVDEAQPVQLSDFEGEVLQVVSGLDHNLVLIAII